MIYLYFSMMTPDIIAKIEEIERDILDCVLARWNGQDDYSSMRRETIRLKRKLRKFSYKTEY